MTIRGPFLFLFFCIVPFLNINAQDKVKSHSSFRDSLDNALDISDWLVTKKGVLLVPTLITEPAVDYGIALAAVFFHSSYTEKHGPPSMTGALGAATLNGTWAAGVFHAGYWKQDRIRYMGVAAKLYANLGFYGSGNLEVLDDEPVNLNLDAWLLLQQIKFRIARSDFFIGGNYVLLATDNTFEMPIDVPEFDTTVFSSTLSEVSLKLELDSRNNVLTPTKGLFIGLSGTYSDTWLGGDDLYGRIGVTMIGYIPAGNRFVLGIRHESMYSLGNIPYYARPIVNMRGAPLMKYQNKNTMVMEADVSYNVYKRWYISGFMGIGNAFSSLADFEKGKSVTTLGTGFRYLIARKLGTRMGVDFAFSQDDFAFYIIFGTAWLR
jgi:Omp85 superfamily domain